MTLKLNGATVKSINTSIGWNTNPSTASFSLVEDLREGDSFQAPTIDTPLYFTFGGFTFNGIVRSWEKSVGADGRVYTINVSDPREILENCQLILSKYSGSTYGIRNLQNIYGYWENALGFGGSQENETGMPWQLAVAGADILINGGSYGNFGGPLVFKGLEYKVDLTQLPLLPTNFRISGTNISLLQLITNICQYGGADFFVELIGRVIKIRTVSRYSQPPLGTITILSERFGGTLKNSVSGLESRNDVTSAFLIGGDYTQLYKAAGAPISKSFWGVDFWGNPITGFPGVMRFSDSDDNVLHEEVVEYMNLNCSEVADILGSVTYPCSTFELRLIDGISNNSSMEAWLSYLRDFRTPYYALINGFIFGRLRMPVGGGANIDLFELNRANVERASSSSRNEDRQNKITRVYNFLKRIATDFMGRQWLVPVPFVLKKIDSSTGRITQSYEVTDGAYFPEIDINIFNQSLSSTPYLEYLPNIYRDKFQTPDGKFTSFAVIDALPGGLDLSTIDQSSYTYFANKCYIQGEVDPKIRYSPEPGVVFKIKPSYAVAANSDDTFQAISRATRLTNVRDLNEEQIELQQAQNIVVDAFRRSHPGTPLTSIQLKAPYMIPSYFFIPLKSNVLKYGPWYVSAGQGKVHFEEDSSFVPWNYGNQDIMSAAAAAKISSIVTAMQVAEKGDITLVGEPINSLGDVMQGGGPNITNISISYGREIVTRYRFETFIPRFGNLGKYVIDSIKTFGTQYQKAIKESRSQAKLQFGRLAIANQASNVPLVGNRIHRALLRESPHNILIGSNYTDEVNNITRTAVSTCTIQELMASITDSGNNVTYKDVAVCTFDHFFKPVSIYAETGVFSNLSSMSLPDSFWESGNTITSELYNPYSSGISRWGTDIFSYDEDYPELGINVVMNSGDVQDKVRRVFALRQPQILTGWGYHLDGNLTQNDSEAYDYKTGPVDHLWDNRRKVWTSHDILKGKVTSVLQPSGNGEVEIYKGFNNGSGTGSSWFLTVNNWFSSPVSSGTRVMVGYDMVDNAWYVIAADCA